MDFARGFALTTFLAAAGCARSRLPEIKSAGQITPEAPAVSVPASPYPPQTHSKETWTNACLAEGIRNHGGVCLQAVNPPVFDLKSFRFSTTELLFAKNAGTNLNPMKVGRFIGHFTVRDPNDATLESMIDLASQWSDKLPPRVGKAPVWLRALEDGALWRSARVYFFIENGDIDTDNIHLVDEKAPYERLFPDDDDSYRKDRLLPYADLQGLPGSLRVYPTAFIKAFLPDWAGRVSFRLEALEIYREDGSLGGCLPIESDGGGS